MVRIHRFFAGMAVLFSLCSADRIAFSQEDPKAAKKEEKKIEMPKLPEGAKPKWDFENLEEKFTIIKGGLNEEGSIFFLLELKEDMNNIPIYVVTWIDKDGVKIDKTSAYANPQTGKKGDRVRLVFFGMTPDNPNSKAKWLKAAKVQIVSE